MMTYEIRDKNSGETLSRWYDEHSALEIMKVMRQVGHGDAEVLTVRDGKVIGKVEGEDPYKI